jgi:monoamine oxidase
LFRALRRTLSKAYWAQRQGLITPAQRNEAWWQWEMQRRQFLQRAVGSVAAAGLPLFGGGCYLADDDDNGQRVSADVVIVGAGIAGLHCAFRLQQAGVRARIFDAWNRVGGRMFSGRGLFAPGQVVELGAEFIDSNHLCMRALADEFELQLDDTITPNELLGITADTYFFNGRLVAEDEIVALFEPLAPVMAAAVEAAETSDEAFDVLDAMSISEWLVANGADPLLQSIFEIAYVAEYGLQADAQTVFNLLCLIDFDVLDPFRLYGDSDERFRMHQGNDTLPARLAERLAEQIELETRLVAVTELADGRFRLTLVRSAGETFDTTADHVVFAIPFTTLRQVDLNVALPDDKLRVIHELGYGTNAKLLGGFGARVWREQFSASGSAFTDSGLQVIFDGTEEQPGSPGVLTNYLGGNAGIEVGNGNAEDRYLEALPLIDQIFPGASAAFMPESVVRMHWPSLPLFQGSYSCYRPGQTSFFGIEGRREGNLHFCGEHTSLDFQGFMEGAAETGASVATEILTDLGVDLPAALRRTLTLARSLTQRHTSPRGQQRRRMRRHRRPGFVRFQSHSKPR